MPPFDILRPPDHARVHHDGTILALDKAVEGRSDGPGVSLTALPGDGSLRLSLQASVPVAHLELRWNERVPEGLRYLGDTWTGAGGDLEWRGLVPERMMPWYFLAYDGQHTHGVGVIAGGGALCQWRIDGAGISLWLDVRSGGGPVSLGERTLHLADVIVRQGRVWEMPFEAARRFAGQLHGERLLPEQCVYGLVRESDSPGALSREELITQAGIVSDLAENTINRPYYVIGQGWLDDAAAADMAALAQGLSERGCRPGLRMRPWISDLAEHRSLGLQAPPADMPTGSVVLDPTRPDTLALVEQEIARARAWGFQFIRHDGSYTDLVARWGHGLAVSTGPCLYDASLTTAEALSALYRAIREAAGPDVIVSGYGSVGQLAAGYVHLQKAAGPYRASIGQQACVRGARELGFRAFQHGALYAVEAGPVRLSDAVPGPLTEQWLRLLSSSGTPCFVSTHRSLSDSDQRALRPAFGKASRPNPVAEPLDWLTTTCPSRWKIGNDNVSFDWFSGAYGAVDTSAG
jgi:alpha-galactosidase